MKPKRCAKRLRRWVKALEGEMLDNVLEVVLVPTRTFVNECGCIRAVQSRNADWYRKLCARYASPRTRKGQVRSCKADTRVRRQNILRVLRRLIRGDTSRSTYVRDILEAATQMRDRERSSLQDVPF